MFHRFLMCSGLAALVNMVVGYLLYGQLGFDHGPMFALSVAVAFLAGMGVSFSLNRRYTYPSSGRQARSELRDFFGVSLGGVMLTTGIAQALDSWAATAMTDAAAALPLPVLPETLAHGIAVGLTAFYSFFAHKLISFRAARIAERLTPAGVGQ
ncbi:GtrA family protein [Primorskyibacter aestuariivivens]|uniref:GtrA family protein n=1 Tax=Primorskyibacter aestuariivivens TaxID=1888912 RepID=UPI002300169B|nr:GtrA family protein [Primorskyibacter aestuariivivens]MDA7427624.1 GtrA family protein [Primorskyibacter aestuariivivens]